MLSDAHDLMWFFSEGQCIAERSPFGRQLDIAENYAAPSASPGMRAGTCQACHGADPDCPSCEGDGRSNPVYLSGEDHEARGRLGDDTALLRYARISRRLLSMRPRHLCTVLVAVYGSQGDRWGRRLRGREWAAMGLISGERTAADWDHLAQLEKQSPDPDRGREILRARKEAQILVESAEMEWRARG